MLKRVTLALDSVDAASWTHHDVENICAFLKQRFPVFPDTGRIYHGEVCQENDVTPTCEEEIARLLALPGPFFVVIYPGWAALPYIFAALVTVAAYVMTPSVSAPVAAARNSQTSSPNNELSDRSNRERINGRIPDIFGTVRSTPDLIAAPYKIFKNNKEVEYAYMCIGRGEYAVSDVRDGDTLCSNIPGASVEVYGPYTSPNSGDDPQLSIGSPIGSRVLNTRRSNSVNGQVLRPPNTSSITGNQNIRFVYPNRIIADVASTIDFTSAFADSDVLEITNAAQGSVSGISELRHFALVGTASATGAQGVFTTAFQDGGYIYWNAADPEVPLGYDVGNTIELDQIPDVRSGLPYPVDFSGVFVIDLVEVYDAGFGLYVIGIKLVDPATVNANWDLYAENVVVLGEGGGNNFEVTLTLGAAVNAFDLAGSYTAIAVTSKEITLDDPESVNADWLELVSINSSPYMSPTISTEGQKWIGPFILEDTETYAVFANFVGVNGLYKDNGTEQTQVTIIILLEITPVGIDDLPLGDPDTFQIQLNGSDTLKETVAGTLQAILATFTGRCAVRASRFTETDEEFEGTVVDEVRWRDLYSVAAVENEDFGNVTTVHTVTFASASALAVKDRKLNLLATRKIPIRVSGSTFTETLTASDDAAEIFSAICLDQYIGRRTFAEMDFENIYDTVDEIEAYFGTDKVRKFAYTFDSDNLSFEETATQVADALFCVAYRRGNVIRLSFEKETDDSTLLFNHRNKIPKSETRSVTFGNGHEFDGLEYTYVDPRDDSIISIFLPPDYAATNPKKVESIGVRDHLQAYFLAWRIWNKMLYQNTTVEFDATQEADLLVRNDRILVADGTRPYTQDGEVVAVDSLELTLSQVVDLSVYASYVIFLQHIDGVAESIDITAGSASNKVVLGGAPRLALVTDIEKYARTAYVIVGNTEPAQTAFLVTDREPQSNMTSTVKAKNYDARYYAHDLDFINELIDENGYGPAGGFVPGTGTGWPASEISPPPTVVIAAEVDTSTYAPVRIRGFISSALAVEIGLALPGSGIDNGSTPPISVAGIVNADNSAASLSTFEVYLLGDTALPSADLLTSVTITGPFGSRTYDVVDAAEAGTPQIGTFFAVWVWEDSPKDIFIADGLDYTVEFT